MRKFSGDRKASDQTRQNKKLQFFEKRFVLLPLVLVTYYVKNVLLSCKAVTELGNGISKLK